MTKQIVCKECGEEKLHYAKGLCKKCYMRMYTRKIVVCAGCGETKPHHAKGMCGTCYDHETGRCNPMSENKLCASYLGVHIAERVLAKVFKDVEVMPPKHPGYDFICGKGFKIDVKSACLNTQGGWLFHINHNLAPDYFLCLAFDNRDDLTPLHVWLLPCGLVNHLESATISPSTLDRWCEYELDVDRVNIQCNILRTKTSDDEQNNRSDII